MKKLLFAVPCLLILCNACKNPETIYSAPKLIIQASGKWVADVIEKEGPIIYATCSPSPTPIDPSEIKVIREPKGVSLVCGRLGDASASHDFMIIENENGCSVIAEFGWQKDGKAKVFLPQRKQIYADNVRFLAEVKRRAEAR